MNWIEKIEIAKLEPDHPDNGEDFPILHVRVTPHEGEQVEIALSCRCLTASDLAQTFRSIAGAIERWGEKTGITTDNLAAMVASGVLPPEAQEGLPG
jgi:hypothetical protein